MVKQLIDSRIVSTPDICAGHPRVTGTRVRVIDIFAWHDGAKKSAEEISFEFDLQVADVHAALDYYFANIDEIKALVEKDKAFVEQMKLNHVSKLPTV